MSHLLQHRNKNTCWSHTTVVNSVFRNRMVIKLWEVRSGCLLLVVEIHECTEVTVELVVGPFMQCKQSGCISVQSGFYWYVKCKQKSFFPTVTHKVFNSCSVWNWVGLYPLMISRNRYTGSHNCCIPPIKEVLQLPSCEEKVVTWVDRILRQSPNQTPSQMRAWRSVPLAIPCQFPYFQSSQMTGNKIDDFSIKFFNSPQPDV